MLHNPRRNTVVSNIRGLNNPDQLRFRRMRCVKIEENVTIALAACGVEKPPKTPAKQHLGRLAPKDLPHLWVVPSLYKSLSHEPGEQRVCLIPADAHQNSQRFFPVAVPRWG